MQACPLLLMKVINEYRWSTNILLRHQNQVTED